MWYLRPMGRRSARICWLAEAPTPAHWRCRWAQTRWRRSMAGTGPSWGAPTGEHTAFRPRGANASTLALPVGTNTVAAQYGGDSLFLGSANSLQQVIQSLSTCSQTNAIV